MGVNWLDVFILIVCIAAFVRGFFTGLIMQVATLAGIVLGVIFAGKLAEITQPQMQNILEGNEQIIVPASYLLSFILILIVVTIIGRLVHYLVKAVLLDIPNKIAGGAFCLLKWILIISILLNITVLFDVNKSIIKEDVRKESYAYPILIGIVQAIVPYLNLDNYPIPSSPIDKNDDVKFHSISL